MNVYRISYKTMTEHMKKIKNNKIQKINASHTIHGIPFLRFLIPRSEDTITYLILDKNEGDLNENAFFLTFCINAVLKEN